MRPGRADADGRPTRIAIPADVPEAAARAGEQGPARSAWGCDRGEPTRTADDATSRASPQMRRPRLDALALASAPRRRCARLAASSRPASRRAWPASTRPRRPPGKSSCTRPRACSRSPSRTARAFKLPYEFLRVYSPSAEVRGHGPGQETLQVGKREVTIAEVEPVGHYAIRPKFSDGHDSGIYSWDYLYELGMRPGRAVDALPPGRSSRTPARAATPR